MKRELITLLELSYSCIVAVNDLGSFLAVPWVGLQFVLVVFPGHTNLPFHLISCQADTLTLVLTK